MLQAELYTDFNPGTQTSCEFVISGSAVFQVKIIAGGRDVYCNGNDFAYSFILSRFTKLTENDCLSYSIKFSSIQLGIKDKTFISDLDGTWHLISENTRKKTFDIYVIMDTIPYCGSFRSLHDDTELTDFELRGEDGSVPVHKAALAAASPVLKCMLGGAWKETKEAHIDIPGTTCVTLQHFKDFIYLHKLPASGIEQLLLLPSCYMMPDLEQKCVDSLVHEMTADKRSELLEFAVKHKIARLMLAVLESVKTGTVDVADIRQHILKS